jgi:1-acyl-sn-glycerol-3-phosphate acyltransferase
MTNDVAEKTAAPARGAGAAAPASVDEPGRDINNPSWLWKLAQVVTRIGTTLYFDLKVYGKNNVPARGGVLLVSNHQSYLDPPLLGAHLPRPMSYLAKSELFENRLVAAIISWLNAFPVRQGAGDVGAVKETIRRLRQGHMLNVFPEGSRTEDGEMLPIQPGVALVIRKAGVPVVPVAIDGAYEAWPKGAKFFHSHPIRVMYGPPMKLDGLRPREIVEEIERTLRRMVGELKAKRPARW